MASSAVSSVLYLRDAAGNHAWTRTGAHLRWRRSKFHEWEFHTRIHIAGKTGDQYIEAMSKVCDGLRGDAFVAAQEVGFDNLCGIVDGIPRGIDTFKEIRNETRASVGLRLIQDRSQGGVCCSFTENENEVYEEKRCELARLEARRFLGKSGCREVDMLEKLECDGASVVGNGDITQKTGIQGVVSDRARAHIASAEEERRWTTTLKDRVELAFWSTLEKEKER